MGVIADVILAVTVVTVAPGAVPELQFRMGKVSSAADGTPMGVGCLGLCGGGFVGACVEGDHLRLLLPAAGLSGFAQHSAEICPPGKRDYIQHVLAEEEEVIGKGYDTEQIVGKRQGHQIQYNNYQVKQSKDPCFNGNEEKQQEMGIGVQRGIAEKQTEVQVSHICLSAEDQTVNIHQDHTGEIEQIKFQRTPDIFHGPAKRIIAEQGNSDQDQVAVSGSVGEGIGKQPPDLALQNAFPVKAQNAVQCIISGHLSNQIDNGGSHGDIEHQVGDAFITVCVAEPFKIGAKSFQIRSLLLLISFSYSTSYEQKSL